MKTNHYKKFNPIRDEVGKPALSNNLQETTYRRDAWKTENTLTYDKTFGEHTVGALFSTTADHSETRGLEVTGKDFPPEKILCLEHEKAENMLGEPMEELIKKFEELGKEE